MRGTAGLSPNTIAMVGLACSLSAIVLIAVAPVGVAVGVGISALLVLGYAFSSAAGRRRGAARHRSIPPGSSQV